MRALHTRLFALRTQARRLRARAALRRPGWVRPAELVLRLDPLGLPGWPSDTKDLPLARLQDRVAEAVRWRGALPVTVVTERLATDERVSEVARFAHRLECRTEIRARATHLSAAPHVCAMGGADDGRRPPGSGGAARTGVTACPL